MRFWRTGLLLLTVLVQGGNAPSVDPSPAPRESAAALLLVVGAPGEESYATNFQAQAALWRQACTRGGVRVVEIGLGPATEPDDVTALRLALEAEPADGSAPLWLVLVGHGTFDGREGRFNLRGPDVSATELAEWLARFRRPLAVVNTASASAPFLTKLAGTNRVVVTATRSGHEVNATRFGGALAEAINSETSDLDQDGQVSLLEAFLVASRVVAESYRVEGRLMTEHALVEDTGDGQGTAPDWFRGVRPVKKAKDGSMADGFRAHQLHLVPGADERALSPETRARRDELEQALFRLRERRPALPGSGYFDELEAILLELARLQVHSEPATAE